MDEEIRSYKAPPLLTLKPLFSAALDWDDAEFIRAKPNLAPCDAPW